MHICIPKRPLLLLLAAMLLLSGCNSDGVETMETTAPPRQSKLRRPVFHMVCLRLIFKVRISTPPI